MIHVFLIDNRPVLIPATKPALEQDGDIRVHPCGSPQGSMGTTRVKGQQPGVFDPDDSMPADEGFHYSIASVIHGIAPFHPLFLKRERGSDHGGPAMREPIIADIFDRRGCLLSMKRSILPLAAGTVRSRGGFRSTTTISPGMARTGKGERETHLTISGRFESARPTALNAPSISR